MLLTDLTPMEQSILDFERAWWQSPGPKGDAIRARLQISPSAYYRRLDALNDHPDAMDLDPLLVRRLPRARADRRRTQYRQRAHEGTSVSERVDLAGRLNITKNK